MVESDASHSQHVREGIRNFYSELTFHKFLGLAGAIIIGIAIIYLFLPLADALLGGGLLAYTMRPLHNKFENILGSKRGAAAITTVLTASPILTALIYGLGLLLGEVSNLTVQTEAVQQSILTRALAAFHFTPGVLEKIVLILNPYLNRFLASLSETVSNIARWSVILFFMFLTMYYVLTRNFSDIINEYLEKSLMESEKAIFKVFWTSVNRVMRSMLYGHILVSILIGLIAAAGYSLIQVPFPLLLAIITMALALLPLIGAWMVYIPISLMYFMAGDLERGISLLLFGVIFLNLLPDFVIRPRLVGRAAEISDFIVILGFITGTLAFGPMGLIYGPFIMGLGKGLLDGYAQLCQCQIQ